jgi:phosphoadenosine phosphosulfate reductase family protein
VATPFAPPEPAALEAMQAPEILALMLEAFPGRVALASSFQKEESVLLDMLFALEPGARVFAIDTHHLFPETYELWREMERRYGTTIEVFEPRGARGHPRRRPLGDEAGPLPRDREGRAAERGARWPRRVDHGRPARPGADACERAEARLGRGARAVEGEPARRLVGRRLLGVHP